MRKSFPILLCLVSGILFSGFISQTHPDTLAVLQKSLELKQLQRILETDANGNYLPIQLISNEFFEAEADLYREGQKVRVFSSDNLSTLDKNKKILELEDLKIKEKKSVLKFMYDNKEVKIKLRKDENQWLFRSILIKSGKGSYYLDIEM